MITEDYVSFETAKLLKEKGFDEYCKSVYHVGLLCSVASLEYHNNEGCGAVIEEKQNSDFGKYDNAISAPTIQMAMKWLREVHNLWCEIAREGKKGDGAWYADVYSLEKEEYVTDGAIRHNISSYERACEAAIKYCLENLI